MDNKSTSKRTDKKGRQLRPGESQRSDGRYVFTAIDPVTKERKYIYSWKLERHDPMPKGKKPDKSLREKIKELQVKDFVGVSYNGGDLTISALVDKYLETKRAVSPSTLAGYKTTQNFLRKDPFGQRKISSVTVMDAKQWLVKLQSEDKKSYSSIHSIRGVIRPAFQLAVESNLIFKNPFDFELSGVLINDSIKREAVSRADERRFLDFIKNDEHYAEYYDPILLLFRTGMRIGELCGLTIADVDLSNRLINIDHQLQYNSGIGKNIRTTKTEAGARKLPMTDEVYEAFVRIIKKRSIKRSIEVIDGYRDFLFIDDRGKTMVGYTFEKKFEAIINKHNKIYKHELPKITPHMCRHTYCTRMATSGISLQTLQYLMGHTDISTTMNVYAHLSYEDASNELERMGLKNDFEKIMSADAVKENKKANIINLSDYA